MTLEEKIVAGIVQLVCGKDAPLTTDTIIDAVRKLALPANHPSGQLLAFFCDLYCKVYRNWDYDGETNGEEWLLGQVAKLNPRVIFDVGASTGNWLMTVRHAMPAVEIHAFEIIEATTSVLAKRVAGQGGITVNPFGLSDATGTLLMRVYQCPEWASCTAFPRGESYEEIARPVMSGDDYLSSKSISRVDFLKLDVEGAEHLVLRGFAQSIRDARIDIIQFEYGKINIFTHCLLKDFYDHLAASGYVVGKLFPDHVDFREYRLSDEDFTGPNYVAVRRARSDIVEFLSAGRGRAAPNP